MTAEVDRTWGVFFWYVMVVLLLLFGSLLKEELMIGEVD